MQAMLLNQLGNAEFQDLRKGLAVVIAAQHAHLQADVLQALVCLKRNEGVHGDLAREAHLLACHLSNARVAAVVVVPRGEETANRKRFVSGAHPQRGFKERESAQKPTDRITR